MTSESLLIYTDASEKKQVSCLYASDAFGLYSLLRLECNKEEAPPCSIWPRGDMAHLGVGPRHAVLTGAIPRVFSLQLLRNWMALSYAKVISVSATARHDHL